MVKIRLTRTGKKHEAHYRIIASDSRSPRDGKFIEILGYYNPRTSPSTVEVKKEKIEAWLKKGAQMTETVASVLKKAGIVVEKSKKPAKKKRVSKNKAAKTAAKAKKAAPKVATKAAKPAKESKAKKTAKK